MSGKKKTTRSERYAGLPSFGEPVFLVVGKLRRPHGVKGEMLMEVLTDFPERLQPGSVLFVGDEHLPLSIRSRRTHHYGLLISFEGYDNPEDVGVFRNHYVYVSAVDRPPLPDGEYYHHQLLGLSVVSDTGEVLGQLTEILVTGANDVYLIKSESSPDLLLPAIDSVILEIDLDEEKMLVHLLPGLKLD
jgi:16S rRNA processing protein RimM